LFRCRRLRVVLRTRKPFLSRSTGISRRLSIDLPLDEPPQERQPVRLTLLGMELHDDHVVTGDIHRLTTAVFVGRDDVAVVFAETGVTVDEVEALLLRARGDAGMLAPHDR